MAVALKIKPITSSKATGSSGIKKPVSSQDAQDVRNREYFKGYLLAHPDQEVVKGTPGGAAVLQERAQVARNMPYFQAYAAAHPGETSVPGAPVAPKVTPSPAGSGPGNTSSAPGVTPLIPLSVSSQNAISGINRGIAEAETDAGLGLSRTERDFYDPKNPMSRQAMLAEQFRQLKSAQAIQQANSGHLYSGSSATNDAFTERDEGYANVSLKTQYDDIMAAIRENLKRVKGRGAEDIQAITAQNGADWAADPRNTTDTGTPPAPEAGASPAGNPYADVQWTPEQVAAIQAAMRGETATAGGRPTSGGGAQPKRGYSHIQTIGPRTGQSYNIVGRYKVYANGDRIPIS